MIITLATRGHLIKNVNMGHSKVLSHILVQSLLDEKHKVQNKGSREKVETKCLRKQNLHKTTHLYPPHSKGGGLFKLAMLNMCEWWKLNT